MKKTLVMGANPNSSKYSYLATEMLKKYKQPVVAFGNREGEISGVKITTEFPSDSDIDTVTLYLNPTNQKPYYEKIIGLKPKRIIFNPGTENPELMNLAKSHGIDPVLGCTLVMLSTGQY